MKKILTILTNKFRVVKHNNLKRKLLISYISITFFPILIISILTYMNTRSSLTNKVSQLSENINSQTQLNIDKYLIGLENSVSIALADHDIMNFNPSDITDYKALETKNKVQQYLQSLGLLNNCTDFALIYDNGNIIGTTSNITSKLLNLNTIYSDLNGRVASSKTKSSWFTGINDNFNKLFYVKKIKENSMLLASVNTNELDNIFNKLQNINNTTYSLIDDNGKVIYSTNKDIISKLNDVNIPSNSSGELSDKDNLVLYTNCNNGWQLLSSTPNKYILNELTTTAIFTSIISILCMISAVVFGSIISKKISNPINKLADKIEEVANGNLTVKTSVHTNDEIEALSNSFNIMVDRIRSLIEHTREVTYTVAKESREMNEMSNESQEISQNISFAMHEIANGSFNQLTELNSTIEEMEKLAVSINNISTNVSQVASTSIETKNIGDQSLKIINELETKTNNTNEIMDEITVNIETLTNSISEIENVVQLINDLNEQTNLLSLNASIEAARAGEHGKGFAVVAEEVRNLAEQSKKSTQNIYHVIKNIYSKANVTKNLINNSKNVFKEQSDAVQFTNKSFFSIIESAEKVTDAIKLIENLMEEVNLQKNKTIDFANSIKAITETSSANTQEVLAAAEEQTNSAEALKNYSNTLNSSINGLEESLNVFKTHSNE